jgi:hypothetical protein
MELFECEMIGGRRFPHFYVQFDFKIREISRNKIKEISIVSIHQFDSISVLSPQLA